VTIPVEPLFGISADSVTTPSVVIFATLLPPKLVNRRLLSGPRVICSAVPGIV
jgi:hypothetical protein